MRYKLVKKYPSLESSIRVGDMIGKVGNHWFLIESLFDRDGVDRDFFMRPISVKDSELLDAEYWEREREFLFTSHNGVSIYSNNDIFILNIDNWEVTQTQASKDVVSQKNTLIFSSANSAATYTWQNKKELSYNDIKYWIDNNLDFPFLERYIKNQLS